MALIGSTSHRDEAEEEVKVSRLVAMSEAPDVIADLSLRQSRRPLWQRIINAGLPAATLPIYTVRNADARSTAPSFWIEHSNSYSAALE
jgi:hypothetical protein